MSAPYPKAPDQILITATTSSIDENHWKPDKTVERVNLKDLLDSFLLKLGYSNLHVRGIISQLMTKGKVHVDFRASSERYELVDFGDALTMLQTMSLFEDYLEEARVDAPMDADKSAPTQRIMVQPPRPRSSDPGPRR